jgi:hypothetical protein
MEQRPQLLLAKAWQWSSSKRSKLACNIMAGAPDTVEHDLHGASQLCLYQQLLYNSWQQKCSCVDTVACVS